LEVLNVNPVVQTENALKEGFYISIDEVYKVLDISRNGLSCIRKRDPTFPESQKNVLSKQGGVRFRYDEFLAWYKNKLMNR